MHRRLRIALLVLGAAIAACSGQTPPAGEATPEIIPEVTPEASAELTAQVWETYQGGSPTEGGWYFAHPPGWEIAEEGDDLFLFSTPGAGDRLFNSGLLPGEMAFQISYNRAASANETPTDHLTAFTSGLSRADLGDIAPWTDAEIEGVQQRGEIEPLGLTFNASSRPFIGNRFIDIIAYSRTDEFDANWTTMLGVILTVEYMLATE